MNTEITAASVADAEEQSSQINQESADVTNSRADQNDSSGTNNEITRLTEKNSNLAAENQNLKTEIAILKVGILEDYRDDATMLAQKLADKSNITFEAALSEVSKKYPQFTKKQEHKPFVPVNPVDCMPSSNAYEEARSNGFVAGMKNLWKGTGK